jgi:glycosyltransferase involved in cell wall biosynthesis
MGIITAEEGVQIYPSGANPFSEDVAIEDYLNFKADMLITIKEPWVFNHIFYQPINFVPMAIIDHSPVSTEITSKLNTAFKVIAVSRFGQMELKRAEIDSYYIPHGVNTSIYKPYPEKKEEYRKLWYLDPDAYTIGIVAMNRSRKLISRMLRGYKRFREMNPNVNSQMLLWTDIIPMDMPEDPQMGVADVGVNLLPEILQLGLNEHVIWPHRDLIRHGLPEWSGEGGKWDMVKLYNCMDVLLHCTGGEGFALPLIEAQACGVVPITTDYAAAPEQVGAGLVVPYSDYVILNTPGTRYALADIDKMAEALTKIHNVDREKLARKARAFALRYDWNNIVEQYWKPFLSKCEEELRPLITKEGIKPWD